MHKFSEIAEFVARHWQDQFGTPLRTFISPYQYTVTFTGLAQSTSATQQLTIQNIDFVLLDMSVRANIGAAQNESTVTAPFVRILVTDSGSGEQFSNAAIDVEAALSNSQRESPLSYPRILQGKSTLSIQATSYAPTAETYSFDLVFTGVQVRTW